MKHTSRLTRRRPLTSTVPYSLPHSVKLGIKLLRLRVPAVAQLAEDNVRQGFLRVPEFQSLLADIPNPNVRDILEFSITAAGAPANRS